MELAITQARVPAPYRVKGQVLSVNDFNKLNETEKITVILERGALLTELQDQVSRYQLYLIDDMYVEVISETGSGRNKSIQIKN